MVDSIIANNFLLVLQQITQKKSLFMKSISFVLITIVALLAFTSCNSGQQSGSEDDTAMADSMENAVAVEEVYNYPVTKEGLTVSYLEGSPAYEEASLSLVEATDAGNGSYSFDFEVENYELGAQTEPESPNGLANSGNGQHIHFIVDNGPYSAYYESEFTHELESGQHVILAFLSRSYHESIKNPNAFAITVINVGDEAAEEVDLDAPHMFYSRPKGTYTGDDINRLLLDFYLLNTTLSPNGNKVRAMINGTEFIFSEWRPYVIEGLTPGEVTVNLELIDAEGNVIDGPFNTVERTVALEAAAQ